MSSRREKLGFTLVELVVAVGLLAMIFSFSGVIFKVCIKSHRMAVANSEIMQKFRVITDQINADFKGLRKDAPMLVYFSFDVTRPNSFRDPERSDMIMFFADGDFQSVQPYWNYGPPIGEAPGLSGQQIRGNIARICYSLAAQPNGAGGWALPLDQGATRRMLARRQNILTADPDICGWPQIADVNTSFVQPAQENPAYSCRERYEHDSMSLSQWMNVNLNSWLYCIIPTNMWEPPPINLSDPNTLHKLWSEGVSEFAIEWAYRDADDGILCWYPSGDPDGAGTYPPHFTGRAHWSPYGAFFHHPGNYTMEQRTWSAGSLAYKDDPDRRFGDWFYPEALRFTFTIHDSHGVYPEGRIFTHIVYLGDRVEN